MSWVWASYREIARSPERKGKHRKVKEKLVFVFPSSLYGEFLPVPNLGDHVFMARPGVFGVVESKLYSYYDDYCNINIILIESYQDYAALTKHPPPADA